MQTCLLLCSLSRHRVQILWVLTVFVLLGYEGWLLRRTMQDAFYIRAELKLMGGTVIPLLLLVTALDAVEPSDFAQVR